MKRLVIILIFLFSIYPLHAQDNPAPVMTTLDHALATLDDLEARGILSADEADEQRDYYLTHEDTLLPEQNFDAQVSEETSGNWWRFISFVNIIWVFASIIIVLSTSLIFIKYIVPLLKSIPVIVYEILLYGACIAFIVGGQFVSEGIAQFVALPGIFGFAFLLPFSYGRRQNLEKFRRKSFSYDDHKQAIVLQNLILFIIWGATAIAYESQLIGFLTIVALMATVTATRAVPAILNSVGFRDDSFGRELMLTSFILLVVYLVMEIQEITGILYVFETGIHWIGAYGYFASLEWMAGRWRKTNSFTTYLYWQVFAVLSGAMAIFIGQIFSVESLTETGGTFLLIYILTKYLEFPNWRQHWLWASLGLGILLYALALLINEYPYLFLFS